jgi:ribosomal protein S18 acetylase RimI-like enzyme
VTTVRAAVPDDAEACVDVLRHLPDYFTPNTHDEARAVVGGPHRTWVVDGAVGGEIAGFVVVEQRFARGAEITFAAVRPDQRDRGIGTALVERALAELARVGVAIVEVKTLDASAGYEPYVATRAFWERRGFVQIDCIDPLPGWDPGNPSAIYVAALTPTT